MVSGTSEGSGPPAEGLDVLVFRDSRESWKKCSLRPLRGARGLDFRTFRPGRRLAAGTRLLLHHEGEELSAADSGLPLLLLDSSWRHLPELLEAVDGELTRRRLPPLRTAYPRRSSIFQDPGNGLASVEALYAALALTGRRLPSLLAEYRFADAFLALNPSL